MMFEVVFCWWAGGNKEYGAEESEYDEQPPAVRWREGLWILAKPSEYVGQWNRKQVRTKVLHCVDYVRQHGPTIGKTVIATRGSCPHMYLSTPY
jgi:hypothetical protein